MGIVKRNWLVILIFILVMIPIYKYRLNFVEFLNNEKSNRAQVVEFCNSGEIPVSAEDWCQDQLNYINSFKGYDFYVMLTQMVVFGVRFLNPFSFLLLVIPTLINVCKILKRKYIINATTRESYHSFLKDYLKKAYKYVWLLPLIALIIIGVCIATTTFDHSYSLNNPFDIRWDYAVIKNRYLFILGYTFNILLYSFFFINLGLIVARKYQNTVIAIIISFLSYVSIELFFEFILKKLIYFFFNNDIGNIFNVMNMWTYSDSWGLGPLFAVSIGMCLLSFIGVYLSYRDKEKLVIACEKNN